MSDMFPDILDWEDEGGSVCGETYDHDDEVTYEDEDVVQWMCRRCGAEGWEDK